MKNINFAHENIKPNNMSRLGDITKSQNVRKSGKAFYLKR